MRPARRSDASSPARSTTASKLAELAREVDVDHLRCRERAGRAPSRRSPRRNRSCRRSTALGASQDRLHEKTLFRQLKIPTPPFAAVDSLADLQAAIAQIGTAGRAQDATPRLRRPRPVPCAQARRTSTTAWQTLGTVPLIYERFVNFSREVSIIGVRSTRGETRFYPLAANTHSAGILRYSIAPYRHASLQKQAETYLKRLLRHFDYAGVLTIEFFVAGAAADRQRDGAARPQFRPLDHRGRADQPVRESRAGDPRAAARRAPGRSAIRAMLNFIGTLPALGNILRVSGVHFHSYGKEPRPNRKLGHCTINAPSPAARDRALKQLLRLKVD